MMFDLEAKDHFTGDGIWLQDHFMGEGIWTHNPDFLQTLEHQAFELHLSDVPLLRKTWDGHFFKEDTSYCHIGISDWEFPPLSPSTWKDVYRCTYTSIKQKYMYICIYIYIHVKTSKLYLQCLALEWQTSMNILPSKISKTRLEKGCNTHMSCNAKHIFYIDKSKHLGKPNKINWNNLEAFMVEKVLKAKPWTHTSHCLPNKFQD